MEAGDRVCKALSILLRLRSVLEEESSVLERVLLAMSGLRSASLERSCRHVEVIYRDVLVPDFACFSTRAERCDAHVSLNDGGVHVTIRRNGIFAFSGLSAVFVITWLEELNGLSIIEDLEEELRRVHGSPSADEEAVFDAMRKYSQLLRQVVFFGN